jgi:hypothetical protein
MKRVRTVEPYSHHCEMSMTYLTASKIMFPSGARSDVLFLGRIRRRNVCKRVEDAQPHPHSSLAAVPHATPHRCRTAKRGLMQSRPGQRRQCSQRKPSSLSIQSPQPAASQQRQVTFSNSAVPILQRLIGSYPTATR